MSLILEKKPVVALSGRSNVGKSLLINRLIGRAVARVSQRPGCTQQIAFYPAEGEWMWADLPGYGYAQAAQAKRLAWEREVRQFLRERRPLTGILIDSRIPPQKLDLAWANWLVEAHISFFILANKIDTLSQKALSHQKKLLPAAFPDPLYWGWISAQTGEGIPAFLDWLQSYFNSLGKA